MVPQGHALFTRAAGSQIPCPQLDFEGGWNKYMAAVYQLPSNETIKSKFGAAFGAQPGERCSVQRGATGLFVRSNFCHISANLFGVAVAWRGCYLVWQVCLPYMF